MEELKFEPREVWPLLSTILCTALSPWRRGSRLCSSTHLGLGKGCSVSEEWRRILSSHLSTLLETLRETWDTAPPSLMALGEPPLSSPGHLLLGIRASIGLGGLANSSGHCLSHLGGDGGVDLGYQMSPAPGHVCLVEAEESTPMTRADNGP